MIGVREQETYLASFERLEKSGPRWLRDSRRSAMERFTALGFPTTKLEDWKYTNVAPIARATFQPAEGGVTAAPPVPLDMPRLVFANGRLLEAAGLPDSVRAGSLRELAEADDEGVAARLARHAAYSDQAFVALNTALFEDGAYLEIPRGVVLEQPIALVFLAQAGDRPVATHPRVLIAAGPETQASVVEVYAGSGQYFTNAVTELEAGDGAVIELYKLQMESSEAFHVATMQYHQARSATVLSHNVSFGGALVRNDVNSVLDGEGGECILNGLYVAGGAQHIDNHTVLDHAKPHCASREYYKGVLDGRATGVFNGKIIVRKDAQKTDAIQSNKNLLLSAEAAINTKPELQIWADDVRCTHGATVGQLDQDAMFYMRTRGIRREAARELLTYAFAADVLGRMKVEAVRELLQKELFDRLSRSEAL